MRLFDTHCHFETADEAAIEPLLLRAAAAGVARLAAVGGSEALNAGAEAAQGLARRLAAEGRAVPEILLAKGLDREQAAGSRVPSSEPLPSDPAVDAVGEIGLDYHHSPETRREQLSLFASQLDKARQSDLPVIIHTREAAADTAGLLREIPSRGVIHCFTGDRNEARAYLDLGFYVSVSGIVTFKAADNVRETARYLPDDRILIETDAPFLAPVPLRGKTNEPSFIRHTCVALAGLRGCTPEAFAAQTLANGARAFLRRARRLVLVLAAGLAALAPAASKPAAKEEWTAGQSIYWPRYIAEGTVYTRSVKDMPVLPNSKEIGAYMKKMPSEYNKVGVITSANLTSFNLPVYTVDSRDPKMNFARVTHPDFRAHMVKPELRKAMFSDPVPIPTWCRRAEGGDRSMAVYDIATGVLREYFHITKLDDRHWEASYGGFVTTDMKGDLVRKNWAMQMEKGTCFAPGILGAPGQIGIAEARRGKVGHAVIFTMANPRKDVVSWPAFQTDGTNENPLAPAEGQWFRLPPGLNLKKLDLQPLTYLVARACQEYGGFASDKNLFCHAFNFEPSYQEEALRGKKPLWEPGGELWEKYRLRNNLMNDFPWELTEWAPPSWGKDDVRRHSPAPAREKAVSSSSVEGLMHWEQAFGARKTRLTVMVAPLAEGFSPGVFAPPPSPDPKRPVTLRTAVRAAREKGCVAGITVPEDIRDYLPFGKKAALVRDGEAVEGLDAKSRAARAFVGKAEDGKEMVFVRAAGARGTGLTSAECAELLLSLGCSDGFELPDAKRASLLFDDGKGLACLDYQRAAQPASAIFGLRRR